MKMNERETNNLNQNTGNERKVRDFIEEIILLMQFVVTWEG